MSKKKGSHTFEELNQVFDYCRITGNIYWKVSSSYKVKSGSVAGSEDSRGYLKIKYQGKSYYNHRLAWMLYYGVWPKKDINHINRIKIDNRIFNLEDVSHQENMRNLSRHPRNSTGYTGVTYHKNTKKYQAYIRLKGKRLHLGLYDTPEEASAAYEAKKIELGFSETHGD